MRVRSQGAAGMSARAPGSVREAIDQIALEGNMFAKQVRARRGARINRMNPMEFLTRTTVAALAAATGIFTGIAAGPGTSSRAFGVANPPPVTKAHNEFSDFFPNISPGYFPSLTLTNQNYNAVNAFLEQRPA